MVKVWRKKFFCLYFGPHKCTLAYIITEHIPEGIRNENCTFLHFYAISPIITHQEYLNKEETIGCFFHMARPWSSPALVIAAYMSANYSQHVTALAKAKNG